MELVNKCQANKLYREGLLHNVSIFGSRPWAMDYHSTLTTDTYLHKRNNKHVTEHLDYAQPIRKERDFKFEYMTRPEVNLVKSKQEVTIQRTHKMLAQKVTQSKLAEPQYNFVHNFVYEFSQPKLAKEGKDEDLRMSSYAKLLFANKERNTVNATDQQNEGEVKAVSVDGIKSNKQSDLHCYLHQPMNRFQPVREFTATGLNRLNKKDSIENVKDSLEFVPYEIKS
eukprot:TRINITY_DN14411_c0_g1_i7.p1 TRINITY_DN14411_c0_g1~~TRINITY_DN14411_c0_g1_i7.p1  ORF type:complete len:226 (+),score=32.65 TRINITY_DN14411_c0_g1_i7:144-821(+)